MKIAPFKLERFFAKHEFSTEYLLCTSDCQGLEMSWLLERADTRWLKLWDKLALGYTESRGHPLLREEIALLQLGVWPDDVLVVSGPEEGIFITVNSLLEPGDHVITTWPAYQSLYEVADSIGCEVTRWPLEEKNNWQPDLNFLKDSIKNKTKLIIVNFPHNPTGFLPTASDFKEIINIAQNHDLYLLSDEVYRHLEYDKGRRLHSAVQDYPRAISISGMSKAFALAGLRIGWVITQDKKVFERIATFKDYTTICCSAPSEILAIIALRVRDTIIARNLNIIKSNLKLFENTLGDFKGKVFDWVQPRAGTIFFPRLLKGQVEEFCEDLRKKEGVLLLPGSVYDYAGNNFRVGLGRKDFAAGLLRLHRYIVQDLVEGGIKL